MTVCAPTLLVLTSCALLGGELKMSLSTNHNMRYPKDVVRHSDIVIRASTHINLQHNTVPYPSDPSQTLRLWEHGDVATFEVRKTMLLAKLVEKGVLLSESASLVQVYCATSVHVSA